MIPAGHHGAQTQNAQHDPTTDRLEELVEVAARCIADEAIAPWAADRSYQFTLENYTAGRSVNAALHHAIAVHPRMLAPHSKLPIQYWRLGLLISTLDNQLPDNVIHYTGLEHVLCLAYRSRKVNIVHDNIGPAFGERSSGINVGLANNEGCFGKDGYGVNIMFGDGYGHFAYNAKKQSINILYGRSPYSFYYSKGLNILAPGATASTMENTCWAQPEMIPLLERIKQHCQQLEIDELKEALAELRTMRRLR